MNSFNFFWGCGLGVCFLCSPKLPLCANDIRVLDLSYLSFRCRSNKVVRNSSRFRFRFTRFLGTENLVRFRLRFVNSMGTELLLRFGFVNYLKRTFLSGSVRYLLRTRTVFPVPFLSCTLTKDRRWKFSEPPRGGNGFSN